MANKSSSFAEVQGRKQRAALISVLSNATLVVAKLSIGFMIGSVSVISEAIHSGVDLVAAAIALYSVRTSSIPADRGHPFGHGKIENVSGTIEALLIFAAAGWIIYEAIHKLIHPEPMEAPLLGVAVMLVSAVANIAVSQLLFKVGRETDSIALLADAWHLRTDVYTSLGVMTGLGIIWLGQGVLPGTDLHWIDPVCAIGVAVLIIKAAYDLTRQAARDLLDASLPPQEEEWIQKSVEAERSIVNGYHALRTRKAGHFRFVEFHIQVDPLMSVAESHALTQKLSETIQARIPNASVTIHVEPCTMECTEKCLQGCLVPGTKVDQR
ncbi:MAG: cation diffusion facilitator family transporter [Desulfobacterales bacterium]